MSKAKQCKAMFINKVLYYVFFKDMFVQYIKLIIPTTLYLSILLFNNMYFLSLFPYLSPSIPSLPLYFQYSITSDFPHHILPAPPPPLLTFLIK